MMIHNTYQYPIDFQNNIYDNKSQRDDSKNTYSQSPSDYENSSLDFSTNLIIHEQTEISIYISYGDNNRNEKLYNFNGTHLQEEPPKNNTETQNNNIYKQTKNNQNSSENDLNNSLTTLTISSSPEEDEIDFDALNGSSRPNLGLDLLASLDIDDQESINSFDCRELKEAENLNKKTKIKKKKVQKPIIFVQPDSDTVKKVSELFVLPKRVNDSLKKNKTTSIFCPIREHKYNEFLKKVTLKEFKLMAKEGPKIPKTWPDKLKLFPSATTYHAYGKNRYRDVLANEFSRVRLKGLKAVFFLNVFL